MGDEPAGTYQGALTTIHWDSNKYTEYTGKSSSTPVVAFDGEVTLTFYKRQFTSETEFILRAELNGEYYEDLDELDQPTVASTIVRWHPITHESYSQPAGPEPSFNFMATNMTWKDGVTTIRSWTLFDSSINDFKVYFRAEMAYRVEGLSSPQIVSVQQGYLMRTPNGQGQYFEGDGPYNPGTDPGEEPGEEPNTCNPIDVSNLATVHAGVTFTYGNNTFRRNSDCSTGRVRKNQPFTTGDILYTGDGQKDMMEVSLGGGSEFSVVGGEPYFRMQRLSVFQVMPKEEPTFRLSKGQMLFRDMKSKIKELYSDEITIETPNTVMGIRGTELYIYILDNENTIVYVTHGEVLVSDLFGNSITLLAGQKIEVTNDQGLGYVSLITSEDYEGFDLFEIDEESNFIWGLILVVIIASPIIVIFVILKKIKRKLFKKKVRLIQTN